MMRFKTLQGESLAIQRCVRTIIVDILFSLHLQDSRDLLFSMFSLDFIF